MRGINEVIGVILMIAVAVLIAAVFLTWNVSFMETEREETACISDTNYIVESFKFNSTGRNEILIKLTNYGDQVLHGFGAIMTSETSMVEHTYSEIDQGGISQSDPLERGESAYITINMSDSTDFARSVKEVIITNEACKRVTTNALVK
jgi:flagellin-like protein